MMLKKTYRKVLAPNCKQSAFLNALRCRVLGHDAVYCEHYEEPFGEICAEQNARVIASSISGGLRPRSVIHVGCGTGTLMSELRECGCEVFGLEYTDPALDACRAKKLRVLKFDLQRDRYTPERKFDLAVSMGVAERLPRKMADRYVELLSQLSNKVVFSASEPGQGGPDDINEQPAGYWIGKFREYGFKLDSALSDAWRRDWKRAGDIEPRFYRNVMVFRR